MPKVVSPLKYNQLSFMARANLSLKAGNMQKLCVPSQVLILKYFAYIQMHFAYVYTVSKGTVA